MRSVECAHVRELFLLHTREAEMKSVPLSDLNKTKPPEPILEHEIRIRAYDLYEKRGKRDGRALNDWLKAEAEILGAVASSPERWRHSG